MKKVILLAGLLASTGAWAAENDFYVLGQLGQTRLLYPQVSTDARLQQSLPAPTSLQSVVNNNPAAYKLQLGYQLDARWAIEGGYADLGQVSYNVTGTSAGIPFTAAEIARVKAWNINAIGKIPVNEHFSLLGKVGFSRVDVTNNATFPAVGVASWVNANTIKTGLTYGLAMHIEVNKQIFARADMDSYDTGVATGRINVWTLGLGYKF